ncbi:MAG TPA: hypothetical protein VFH15_04815 [Pyrinomonadaceae bacterium]|nr:hypothetical protein [Pyrinomonadaceae bacterium]
MKIFRRVVLVALLILFLAFVWIWLNRPQRTDMSASAPASALIYLESNSLMEVADGIAATDTWKQVKPLIGETKSDWPSAQTLRFIAFTGIGPTASVIIARAQIGMVMLDLGAREEAETITLKPEAAVLIETHTSKRRIKTTVEQALQTFAERLYTRPTLRRTVVDGDEFLIWSAADNNRQIVAVIDDSLVIVANSDRAVKACLEARRSLRPSLNNEPELQKMKNTLNADGALAFGFVPSSHAPELLALATPVALGRAPGGAQIDGLVARSAAKILSSAGWSSKLVEGAIEDHYFFTLNSTVVSRMRPVFQPSQQPVTPRAFVPKSVQSVTVYRFKQADETWRELQTTLSSQLDTLSAVLVTSVLKSGLTTYGIDDPEKFLRLVGPEIMTLRLKANEASSVLIAQVRDEPGLRALLKNPVFRASEDGERKLTVHYQSGYVLMGSADDVQSCLQATNEPKLKHFGGEPSATIVTYSDDSPRVADFISALARAQNTTAKLDGDPQANQALQLPYAVTETSLSDSGLERRTRSPFGQFSALVPLLFPPN